MGSERLGDIDGERGIDWKIEKESEKETSWGRLGERGREKDCEGD